ncbi:MAG: NADH-quinone oxidoreductase subunit NuoN [Betaproteobacteria bacterium]
MNVVEFNLFPVLPEVFLLCAVSLLLIVDLFVGDDNRHFTYWLTQLTLLVCAGITLATFRAAPMHTFSNMVVDDWMSDVLKFSSYVTVSLTLFYARDHLRDRGLFRGEFFALTLFSLLGVMVMISANTLLILYLGLELMSLSLYALVAMHRDRRECSEAAMKYFVLGALASGLLLYGMSMVYGATGTLDLNAIFTAILNGRANSSLLVFGLVFLVSGVAFKLGAVPYHMWVPDVYDGAPTPVTLLIGTAPKLAAFAFIMRLLVSGLQPLVGDWHAMLLILSVLSMIIGNLTAIAQTNLKRMLAYSTIANMGFMLLGFVAGVSRQDPLIGYAAAMFYTMAYALTTVASFGIILLLSRKGFEADKLDDLKGLNQRNPWYAFIVMLVMFSLAGVPLTVGFFAKLTVIEAVIGVGYYWLAIVAVLASLVGAYYYLRIVKLMYFDEPVDTSDVRVRGDAHFLFSVNGLALLVLGIVPQPLLALCYRALHASF